MPTYGVKIATSTIIGPSALQKGLLTNLEEAGAFINSFQWKELKTLREEAIKSGFDGYTDSISVYEFTKKIVDIAIKGLHPNEKHMLSYVLHVLETKQNGADRAIEAYRNGKTIQDIVKSRNVITE